MTVQKSLYDSLTQYKKQGIYPFHMPGHKRSSDFLPHGLLDYDITEIPGFDNLQKPEGILKELEAKISYACKSERSFISLSGSSGAILAALLSTVSSDDELLLARNSHVAAYNGLVLSGAFPRYVYPQITPQGLCGGVLAQDIENELLKNSKIRAVLITSPTYEGFCSDIKGIAKVVHRYGKILIVDEAHGAHFGYHPAFPASAITQGADISIQSLHKTLPAFGQSSVLHLSGNRVDAAKIKHSLNIVSTTSPSYIFLTGIDFLFSKTLKKPFDIFEKYIQNLAKFEDSIKHIENIEMPAKPLKGKFGILDIDIGKLVFFIKLGSLTGHDVSDILLRDYKVQVEAAYLRHIIAMTSIADKEEGFLRLSRGINGIHKMLKNGNEYDIINNCDYVKANIALSPRCAFNCEKDFLPLDESIGKICGEFVVPYPPGIPIVAPGEIISEDIIEVVKKYFSDKGVKRINMIKDL
ncbi:MAG: aminotransferase class I/II-fold pyridoxal phosphate-dependent enzyme [Defluviitaleaceae bacterium]|nr:aminotransferase class I/II-fold pyridoxal phosphate-dependent enzyme [Defluviitaleaceae bacterium]